MMLRKTALAMMAVVGLAVAACDQPMSPEQRVLAGGATGAVLGGLTAAAFDANPEWTIAASLAGAAAGALVARHRVTNECAYAVGDGTFVTGPCPD